MSATNLGFHCSAGPGYVYLFETVAKYGLDTFQIFTKNQRQWKEKLISPEDAAFFRKNLERHGIRKVLSHCAYLINLASADPVILDKSLISLLGEVLRCDSLGIKYAVLHPGASKDLPEKEAISRIAKNVARVLRESGSADVEILLENTAGQGSSIGRNFGQLKAIMEQAESNRIGVCFDTCHAFVSGYDIRSAAGFEDTMSEFDRIIGLGHLKAFHMNDSKCPFNSRADRHEHIGLGKIGEAPFREIMCRFPELPKVIETNHDNQMHVRDLELLRGLGLQDKNKSE
jgi:deoxyribonuclease IV